MELRKIIRMKRVYLALCMIAPGFHLYADIMPAQDSAFYYEIGGGQDVALPASDNTVYVPLDLNAQAGLGWDCGSFSPTQTIEDSLNDAENAIENVPGSIVKDVTPMVLNYPMYLLAREDPKLYNMIQNNLLGANDQFQLSLKSCQAMEQNMSQGQDPYQDWATISMGNDWKKQMSYGATNPNSLGASGGTGDINNAYSTVSQNAGANGVPWLGSQNAGGQNQPPINVINDTVTAGFNLIFNRPDNSTSSISPNNIPDNPNSNHIADYWTSPAKAAQWVTGVVGDQQITTYTGGPKGSTPGMGLSAQYQQIYPNIFNTLSGMVSGSDPITEQNLQAVSAPGIEVNSELIQKIQSLNTNTQAIVVNKLAENITMGITVDKALLAVQLLTVGAQDPNIKAMGPAQTEITDALGQLNSDLQQIQTADQLRSQLISKPMEDVINYVNQQSDESIAQPKNLTSPAASIVNGAVMGGGA